MIAASTAPSSIHTAQGETPEEIAGMAKAFLKHGVHVKTAKGGAGRGRLCSAARSRLAAPASGWHGS